MLGENQAGLPWIETIPKRGYRFIGTMDAFEASRLVRKLKLSPFLGLIRLSGNPHVGGKSVLAEPTNVRLGRSFGSFRMCPVQRRAFVRAEILRVTSQSSSRASQLVLTHKSAAVQNFGSSGSSAVVVVQHAAQSLPALNLTDSADMARFWTDESVRQALVIAFAVIVGDEF